jgi:ketosteroid isomerase-like protein
VTKGFNPLTSPLSADEKLALAAQYSRASSTNNADALREMCAPDAVTWHNFDEVEVTTEQTIRTIGWLHRTVDDLNWIDISFQATATGWVSQSILAGAAPGGALRAHSCVVVTLNEHGKIVRTEEYLDPAQLAVLSRPKATPTAGETTATS